MATGYTGTVHFTSSDAQAVLPANYTFTAGDTGVHTFTASPSRPPARQTITATDTVTSSITGTQSGHHRQRRRGRTASPSAGFPSPTTAGAALSVTVTALDPTATSPPATPARSTSPAATRQAVLPANYTFTAGDDGIHTFPRVTLKTAGTQTITATDTVTGSITGTRAASPSTRPAAARCTVTGFPSPTTAGAAAQRHGDRPGPLRQRRHRLHRHGPLHQHRRPGRPAGQLHLHGRRRRHPHLHQRVTLKTAGTQSITATDTVTGSITGTQSGITVNAAARQHLHGQRLPQPDHGRGGRTASRSPPRTPTATWPPATRGTVHFTSTDAQAVLPANYTFTAGDAGAHTFSVTLETAGTQTITATDTVTGSITGTQSGITVNAAAAFKLGFGQQPGTSTAGSAISPAVTVQVQDQYGNAVSSSG